MAGQKFLTNSSGTITEIAAIQSSAGAGDAGKLLGLDSNGRIDTSAMPVGVVADTASVVASEALNAGEYVNVWSSSGAFRVRKADGTTAGKETHGFVLSAVVNGGTALVYFSDTNTQVSGATPGVQFLSTTPGGFTATAPSGAGNVVQKIGIAVSATAIVFEPLAPIVLA